MSKSKAQKPKRTEPTRGVGVIVTQANPHTRDSKNDTSFVLMGMTSSLAKTFATRQAAEEWAAEHGIRVERPRPRPRKAA